MRTLCHDIMDILCRNIRTGEEKPLPAAVLKAVGSKWKPIQKAAIPVKEPVIEPAKAEAPKVDTLPKEESPEISKEHLQTVYESLSGKKPDGRWNEKKLTEKIQELKETK